MKRYELTVAGQKYFQQYPTAIRQANSFCYGQKQVDSIVKWDEPVTQGSYSVTQVTYTYKVEQLAGWAAQPSIQRTSDYQSDTGSGKDRSGDRSAPHEQGMGGWKLLN